MNEDQKRDIFCLGVKIFICLQKLSREEFLSELNVKDEVLSIDGSKLTQIFISSIKNYEINPKEIPLIAKSVSDSNLKIENFEFILDSVIPYIHDSSFLPNFYEILHLPSKTSSSYRKNQVKHQKGSFFTPIWLVREIISLAKFRK